MKKRLLWAGIVASYLFFCIGFILQVTPPSVIYHQFVQQAQADISSLTGVTGKIGREDINFGTGETTDTFTVTGYRGTTITLTRMPSFLANAASIIKGKWYVPTAAAITDHGAASGANYTSYNLKKVIDVIDGAEAAIELPGSTSYTVTTALTIPATATIEFQRGAQLAGAGNLTFSGIGSITAGRYQIFDTTGTITFAQGQQLFAEWFASLSTAVDKIGSVQSGLSLCTQELLTANLTTPSTLSLAIKPGGCISITGSYTLTINGPFEGCPECFTVGLDVGFGDFVSIAHPYWWKRNAIPGSTNMTAAIQAALDTVKPVELGATDYLVTESLKFKDTYILMGQNKYPSTLTQSGVTASVLTRIIFSPASALDLFDLTTLSGHSYATKIRLSGIHCTGNNTAGGATARYGINSKAAQSTFENMGFEYFLDGIYCNFTMSNKYKNIYLGQMQHSCIYTSSSLNTTDTFDNIIMRESPWGCILVKGYGFKFINPLFESLTEGGMNIYKECAGTTIISGYSENVPSGATDTYGMFRVNKDGTTLGAGLTTIIGGKYVGHNGGGYYGSFLDAGETSRLNQVSVIGTYILNWNRGFRADITDSDYCSIYLSGIDYASVTTMYTNEVKTTGHPIIYGMLQNTSSGYNLPTLTSYTCYFNYAQLVDSHGNGTLRLAGASDTELADANEIIFTGGSSAWSKIILVAMTDNATIHEAGMFSVSFVSGAVTVIKISGSANTSVTNSDGNLCVYPNSTSLRVMNQLGATVNCRIFVIG